MKGHVLRASFCQAPVLEKQVCFWDRQIEETEDVKKELNNAFNYLNSVPTIINNFVNSIIVQPMKVVANNLISILNKINSKYMSLEMYRDILWVEHSATLTFL